MLDERDIFEARVRERAFHMWQEAGCPENTAEEFWHRARAAELDALNLTPKELDERLKSPVSEAADFA
jgi:hypothetical protein